MSNKFELTEFEHRKDILNLKSNTITLTSIEDIYSDLGREITYMDYLVYFYDNGFNDYSWVEVESINEGWIHTDKDLKTDKDIIRALKESINRTLDAIEYNSDDNNITCFVVQEHKKKLYHIVELSKDHMSRIDFSIYLELEEN